jgi:hypothetical protein
MSGRGFTERPNYVALSFSVATCSVAYKRQLFDPQKVHRRYFKNIVNGNGDSMFLPQTFTASMGVSGKRPEIWQENSWFLDHDNDPAHAALSPSSFSREAKLQQLHGHSIVLIYLQKTSPFSKFRYSRRTSISISRWNKGKRAVEKLPHISSKSHKISCEM